MMSEAEFAAWIVEDIERRLWETAQATGNAHSVTGDYRMERIYND